MKDKCVAIILSAGIGKRMNSNVPKQYLKINNKEIIYYTINAFEKSDVDEIIIVVGSNDIEYCKEHIVNKYGFKKVSKVVVGGGERYTSVYNGLNKIDSAKYVLIHDGARPGIKKEHINNMIEYVKENKACIMAVRAKDTIKIVNDNKIIDSPDRNKMWQAQTPQVFEYEGIKKAYNELIKNIDKIECHITDDASVWSMYEDAPVYIYEGEYSNLKITTGEDIKIISKYLDD